MTTARKICPACNANCDARDATCWLCLSPFTAAEAESAVLATVVNEGVVVRDGDSRPVRAAPGSFSLMSLMMIMTLIAVCMGAFTVAPGLGILISVLATPALIRTAVVSLRKKEAGVAVSPGDKAMLFVASLGAVLTAGLAAIAVFFGTCVAICFGAVALDGSGLASGDSAVVLLYLLILLGVVAGIATAVLVLRRFWSKR